MTPDGRRILSAGQSTVPITQTKLKYGPRNVTLTEIRLWDLETGERIKDLQGREDYGRGYAALSRDGRRVAVGDFGMLRILDAATGRPERTISLPVAGAIGPRSLPTGRSSPWRSTTPSASSRWGPDDGCTTTNGRLKASSRPAAWSPSGDRIVTGHSDGEVRVWEAATGKLLWHKLLAPVISPSGWNAGRLSWRSLATASSSLRPAGGMIRSRTATASSRSTMRPLAAL